MNHINCLITTAEHKHIAEELKLNPAVVTNLASVFSSEHLGKKATKDDIEALLKERESMANEAYLAIPIYTDTKETVQQGKPLVVTSPNGEIKLYRLPKESGIDYFYDYIQGNTKGDKSNQLGAIFDALIEQGKLNSIEEFKEIISNPNEAYQFLLWYSMAHKRMNTKEHYWDNGKNYMTRDKLNMEYLAIIEALDKAKEYRKKNPIQKKEQFSQNETIKEQLISHLKNIGLTVNDRVAMKEFLKTHKIEGLQQAVAGSQLKFAHGVRKPKGIDEYLLSSAIMTQANTFEHLTETLQNNTGEVVKRVIFFGDNAYLWSTENGYNFFIEQSLSINTRNYNTINAWIDTYGTDSKTFDVIRSIEKLRSTKERKHRYIELTKQQGANVYTSANSRMDGHKQLANSLPTEVDGNSLANSEGQESFRGIEDSQFFTTPQGEIYGFVDKDGNIYLDETKISPEHPIHEYTHLWDRIVQQKNPKLWQRGVELMKETSMWNTILEDEHYGKKWQFMGLTQDRLDNLIASEVHSRFTGKEGEKLLNDIAKEKGESGIITKLKQWMLDVWKDTKATFGNWSQNELDKLTLEDFNQMTIRDFTDGVNLKITSNTSYVAQERGENNSIDNMPKIGIDRIKINQENPVTKLAASFTPQQCKNRINWVARTFTNIVNYTLSDLVESKEEELALTEASGNLEAQKEIQKSLDLLKDPVKGKQFAIAQKTLESIIEDLKAEIEENTEIYSGYNEYQRNQWQLLLDNFDFIFSLATPKIEKYENIKIKTTKRKQYVGKSTKEVLGGDVEESIQTIDDEGREQDDDDEDGDRATGNEGWAYKSINTDPHTILSQTTKFILSQIHKKDENNENELDDLGQEVFIDEQYAHGVLLHALSNMTDPSDFCIQSYDEEGNLWYEFPALDALESKYPWISEVKFKLNEELIENNHAAVSAFYADMRKDFNQYCKSKEDIEAVSYSVPLNQQTGIQSLKNTFIDNYELGIRTSKMQIWDKNKQVDADNCAKAQELLDAKIKHNNMGTEKDIDNYCEATAKLLGAIGLSIKVEDIKAIWETPNGEKDLDTITTNIGYIIEDSLKHTGQKNYHIISGNNTAYTKISGALSLIIEDEPVNTFREGDKSYYSYSAPNYINTQIKLFNSLTKCQEYIDKEFKEYDFFYDKESGKWKGDTTGIGLGAFEELQCWLSYLESRHEWEDTPIETKTLLIIDENTELGVNHLTYTNWQPKHIRKNFVMEFINSFKNHNYKKAFYNYPIFSDSPIAKFIKMPATLNLEGEIVPLMRQVVKQELERINLVMQREKLGVSPITNFDGKRGKQFCFFPCLNNWVNEDGTTFREKIAELKPQGIGAINAYIDKVVSEHMQEAFEEFYTNYEEIAKELVEKGIEKDILDAKNMLKCYFYNSEYATTQIIQLTTTDLAYYKDGVDFQKRYKEVYASGTKLNTLSKFSREFEKTLYLSDNIVTSRNYTNIKGALLQAKKQWIADGMDTKIAQMNVDSILHKFKEINVADAQAYRSLTSFRAMLDMQGLWTDDMQKAFDRIQSGKWDMRDFNIVWQTVKPFVYTQISKNSHVGDTKIKVPHQNKNSEFLLLAMYQMFATSMRQSPQLVALNKFMEKNNIDVVQFESAVKAGKQGCIDITYSEKTLQEWIKENPKKWEEILKASTLKKGTDYEIFKDGNDQLLDADKITQKEYNKRMDELAPTEDEVTEILNTLTLNEDGSIKDDVIHTIPYRDYMLAQPTPEHFFDKNEKMSEAVFGSQFRNLIVADIPTDAVIQVNGKSYNKQKLLNLYNSIQIENLLEDYNRITSKFNTIEDFQQALLKQIEGNSRYSNNLINALQLIDWTDPNTGKTKRVFNIPLYSPSISNEIQSVVLAMFKNAITRQKIKGAACILVSNFGLTDKLNIKYKEDGSIDYVPCYLPWYCKNNFEAFLKPVTRNGITYQEVDINNIPNNLLEMVGYRIPTEDKYSMIPLRVVGFLPQQNGGTIMVPADITVIAGSDFDVDKLFMMMPAYDTIYYDKRQAIKDFKKINSDALVNNIIFNLFGADEALEESTDQDFNDWWKEHKEEYKLEQPIIKKVKYNSKEDASKQSRAARDNMLIDISRSILRYKDTASKIFNPGNFDTIKLSARLNTILSTPAYLFAYAKEKGIEEPLGDSYEITDFDSIEEMNEYQKEYSGAENNYIKAIRESLKKETLESLNKFLDKYKQERDPLSLETFIFNHKQNMVGSILIGIYANNTTMQAKYQGSGIRLKTILPKSEKGKPIDYTFTIDGHKIVALDQIISPWGERISKNCAEFSAASVDNVKDPVLALLMQTTDTAKISGFMLRAGIPINIIGLMFNQPVVKALIEKSGTLTSEDLNKYLDSKVQGHISITSNELMYNIIKGTNSPKIIQLMANIVKCAEDLNNITQVSRADAPKGSIATVLGKARNQVAKTEALLKLSEDDSFTIGGLNKALIKNECVNQNDSLENMRDSLKDSKMSRLQAFYSLGIRLPLQVMSSYFVQLNSNIDNALKGIYEQAPYGRLSDEMVVKFYTDYIEYMLTESSLFGNDEHQTFKQKRDYYLYEFPSKFLNAKVNNPKFEEYTIMKKIRVKNGDIILSNAGKLTSEMKENLSVDFDSMISSSDEEVVQMAIDLFMYSFYKNGYNYGPNSFGNFFSPFFLQSFPEFMDTLRGIEHQSKSMDMSRFVSQFYNNYWQFITKKVKSKKTRSGENNIELCEPNNPYSDIMVNEYYCRNKMTGKEAKPYKYIQYNGNLYCHKSSSSTVSIYYRVLTVTDEQGKKYNASESIEDMIKNQTNKELIEANKKVGASMSFADSLLDSIGDAFEGLDALDNMDFESLDDMNFDFYYDIEKSQDELEEPLC
jgi:hypothetical protein